MRKDKTFAKIIFIVLATVFLFSVSSSYATNTEIPSDDIERIEYGDNSKITYFKNGIKLLEVSSQINSVTTLTTTVTTISTGVLQPINVLENIKLIIEIIGGVVGIVFTILCLFGLKLYYKNKKKPSYIRSLIGCIKCQS